LNPRSLLIWAPLILLASCSNDISPPEEPPDYTRTFMFDYDNGFSVAPEPDYLRPRIENNFNLSIIPKFSGKGSITMIGHGAGRDIGNVLSPVTGPIGVISFPVYFNKDQAQTERVSIDISEDFSHIAITFLVAFDSLTVNGITYGLNEDEAIGLIGIDPLRQFNDYIYLEEGKLKAPR